MTNSTIKKNSIFRKGFITLLVIFFALTFLYFKFLFDSNLKTFLGYTLSKANRATVDIKSLKTSFREGHIKVKAIEFADKKDLLKNKFEIDEIALFVSIDALLRGKFIIENVNITKIMTNTTRKKKAKLVLWDEKGFKENKQINKLQKEITKEAKETVKSQYKNNILGGVLNVLDSTDYKSQIKSFSNDLDSKKKILDIENNIKTKKLTIETQIKKLQAKEKISKIKNELKVASKEKDLVKKIKKVKGLVSETKKLLNDYKKNTDTIKKQFDKETFKLSEIDQLVKNDVKNIKQKLSIPEVNLKGLSNQIFKNYLLSKIGNFKDYLPYIKKILPIKKESERQENIIEKSKKKRNEGKTYRFTTRESLPLFWIKDGKISSKFKSDNNQSISLKGNISNLTSDPTIVKKPGLITLNGNLANKNQSKFSLYFKLNHHNEKKEDRNEKFNFEIEKLPLDSLRIIENDKLKFNISGADTNFSMTGRSKNELTNFDLHSKILSPVYDVQSPKKNIQETFRNITKQIKDIEINAKATGKWDQLNWYISSTLGDQITLALKNEIKVKIKKAEEAIEKMIYAQIAEPKKQINKEMEKIKRDIYSKIKKDENIIKNLEKNILKELKSKSFQPQKIKEKLLKKINLKKFKL